MNTTAFEDLFSFRWWDHATEDEMRDKISEIDVHSRGERGRTVLMMAALKGSPDNIRSLIEAGANLHTIDDIGWTALFWATRSDSPCNVELLLDAGSNIETCDRNDRNAFSYAKESDNLRGTELYWRLSGSLNPKLKTINEVLSEILLISDHEGADLIMGPPRYEQISLVFDQELRPIVAKKADLEELEGGKAKRAIGARIDNPELIAIRAHDLEHLSSIEAVENEIDQPQLLRLVRDFMSVRNQNAPPLLSGRLPFPSLGLQTRTPIQHLFR